MYPNEEEGDSKEQVVVHQRWFPGTHYDVGRMTFRFIRQSSSNWVEDALGWLPDLLSRTIYPNEVLSDTVLRWLVQGVHNVDEESENPLMPNADEHIHSLSSRLVESSLALPTPSAPSVRTGSGDIYGDILAYAPGGRIFSAIRRTSQSVTGLLNNIFPQLGDNIQSLLGIKTLVGILTATADRRIPGTIADVYPYMEEESVVVEGGKEVRFSVERLARLNENNERGTLRYPSQTFEAFSLWQRVFGLKKEAGNDQAGTVEQSLNVSNTDIETKSNKESLKRRGYKTL